LRQICTIGRNERDQTQGRPLDHEDRKILTNY
jgi:hypothetical protein